MHIISASGLKKYFPAHRGFFGKKAKVIKAVDGVTFSVNKGEALGIVGESGSGKTTLARLMLRLLAPSAGTITFEGENISGFRGKKLLDFRRRVQVVFQDPHRSLNPRMTAGETVGEGLIIHKLVRGRKERAKKVSELLEIVGLGPSHVNKYPHQESGGQCQRIGIARALSTQPEVLIADEPVSSLDVSIQAQILNLLKDLQDKLRLTLVFIAHDLRVVRHICTRIIVMDRGKIAETAKSSVLYENPVHPYTKTLLNSIPRLTPVKKQETLL